MAYNRYDAGNYYTGYTSAKIKIPRIGILLGAHYNNIFNANKDNRKNPEYKKRKWYQLNKLLDPLPDQRALWNGHKAGKN
ncbi:MAG: hypothetical protein ACOC4B_01935 [Bacteroidota bacterium]